MTTEDGNSWNRMDALTNKMQRQTGKQLCFLWTSSYPGFPRRCFLIWGNIFPLPQQILPGNAFQIYSEISLSWFWILLNCQSRLTITDRVFPLVGQCLHYLEGTDISFSLSRKHLETEVHPSNSRATILESCIIMLCNTMLFWGECGGGGRY